LAYDVLELHRAAIAHAVFAYVQRRIFLRADFELTVDGIVVERARCARGCNIGIACGADG
jgi:hypothetical protein